MFYLFIVKKNDRLCTNTTLLLGCYCPYFSRLTVPPASFCLPDLTMAPGMELEKQNRTKAGKKKMKIIVAQ